MADETTTAPAGAPADETTTASVSADTAPRLAVTAPTAGLITYVVGHRLLHDGKEYAPGATFQHSDPQTIAALRKAKAIVLQTEMQAADEVAARMAALEAQLAATQQENARLQREREVAVNQLPAPAQTNSGKGGK